MIVIDVSRISRLYSRDFGFLLIVETGIDLRESSALKLLVEKPDGSKLQWDGMVSDKKPTQLRCYVSPAEIMQRGIWKCQSYVEKDGKVLLGDIDVFRVF